ncbi:uncharacterized protein LOC122941847 [Bufo gargarizans]|uniref:uncharacterized protein LOC122941847 n=1 Tax=Bufo gargarizans TaxID=30331 RepID=UPI001CF15406|nr:uncharacterized protein LOC122941847 [Bufo gargarizans]
MIFRSKIEVLEKEEKCSRFFFKKICSKKEDVQELLNDMVNRIICNKKIQDMDLTDEEISRQNSQSTLDSTLDINTEEEIIITFSSGQDSEIIISSNYDIVQCIVEDEGEYIFPFAEQDFSGDPEHTAAAEQISNLKDRIDNTRNSVDEELQTLLSEMKAKYTADTQAIGCFPENPRRSENENYIVFNETEDENRVGSVYWCQCGNCIPMRTNIESVCCKEITNAEPLMDNLNCKPNMNCLIFSVTE